MVRADRIAKRVKPKLDVFVIYQGKNANLPRQEVCETVQGFGGGRLATFSLSKFGDKTADASVLSHFQADVWRCGYAIAIVTEDPRSASAAGNLWFEVGYWIAKKGRANLLICVDNAVVADAPPFGPLISDLTGVICTPFDSIDKLKAVVTEGLASYITRHETADRSRHDSSGRYTDTFRVRDTLGSGEHIWDLARVGCCRHSGPGCESFRESLLFLSELLRMGRVNAEQANIQSLLKTVSKLVVEMYQRDHEMGDQGSNETLARRRESMRELESTIGQLTDFVFEYFQRTDSQRGVPLEESFDRLEHFLRFRIEVLQSTTSDIGARRAMQTDLGRLPGFIGWLRDYRRTYQRLDYYERADGGKCNSERLQIYEQGTVAGLYASYLYTLFHMYFPTCREVIRRNLKSVKQPEELATAFSRIRTQLPHNAAASEHLRIWPGASGDTK